jgi:hypothetical protein
MFRSLSLSLLSAIALAMGAPGAIAQDAASDAVSEGFDGMSLFLVGFQVDEDGARATHASFGQELTRSTWVQLSGGFTEPTDDDAGSSTRFTSFDLEQMFGIVGFGAGVEFWGDGDDLRTTRWRGTLLLRPGNFRLRGYAERRKADVTFEALVLGVPVRRKGNLEITGYGGSAGFFADNGFNAFVTHTEWEYSDDPQGLAFLARFTDFTKTALTLSNSFLQRTTMVAIGYSQGMNSFNVDFARDISAVDREEIFTYSGSWTRAVAVAHDLEFRLGLSDTQALDPSMYFGLTWYHYR